MLSRHRALAFAVSVSALFVARSAVAQDPAAPSAQPAQKKGLVAPQLKKFAEPVYPPSKLAAGERAKVTLTLTIDATGRVTDAVVATSAGPEFDGAAILAARDLVFEPATRDGVAIASKIPFAFTFDFAETPAAPAPAPAPTPAPSPAPAPAPAKPDPLAGASTADIDVKGERPAREVTRRAITGAEIVRIPGTRGDALRSLENLPGVARPPGLSGLLIVRGSGPEDTRVLVDGTEIPIAYHFGGLTSVMPSEMLDRLDFYPGNFSAQYGRAMGGIVDIGVRSPKKDRIHGLVQVDLLDARAVAEGPIGSSTRFMIAARRSWIDAWIGPVLTSGGASVSTAPRYYDYQALVEHDFSPTTTGRVFVFGSDDRLSITLNNPSASDPGLGGGVAGAVTFWRAQARLDTRIGDVRWINTASVGQDIWRQSIGDRFIDITGRPIEVRSDVRVPVNARLTVIGGVDIQATHYDASTKLPPFQDPNHNPGPLFAQPSNRLDASADVVRPGAYVMLDVKPFDALTILPGVRVDYARPSDAWTVDPRLAARWDVRSGERRTTIKGGTGIFHQPPLPQEIITPFGTPGVGPNRAMHYSVGVEQELSKNVEVSIEGFYKDLDHLVSQQPSASSTSGLAYGNTGSGRVYGSELMLRYKPDGRFFGWIAYTLSKSERREADDQAMHPFQYDQRHIFTALGSYKLGRGWEIGVRWRYVSGNRNTPFVGGVADYDAGAYAPVQSPQIFSASDPAFHRLDVRVEKTWTFKSWNLSAYLDVQNVYNRQNPEGAQYNYNYSRTQVVPGLPILPIIGVRGEL